MFYYFNTLYHIVEATNIFEVDNQFKTLFSKIFKVSNRLHNYDF